MEPHAFTSRFPRLYHLAHADAWPGIQQYGLLSSQRLIDLFDGDPAVLTSRRSESIMLSHPEHGVAVLRDQKPLSEERLASCLDGMTVPEWLALLNGFVFLFPDEASLMVTRNATAYSKESVVVLTLHTGRVLALPDADVRLRVTTFNTGYTMRKPKTRNRSSLLALSRFPGGTVKEVVVTDALPEVMSVLVSAERWSPEGQRADLLG